MNDTLSLSTILDELDGAGLIITDSDLIADTLDALGFCGASTVHPTATRYWLVAGDADVAAFRSTEFGRSEVESMYDSDNEIRLVDSAEAHRLADRIVDEAAEMATA